VGLKVNANKSHFAVSEIEHLGYWITRNGIQPVHKKVKAIQCIAPLTTKKQVHPLLDSSTTIKTCGLEDLKF
jgi:hypothetical protein